MTLFFLKKNNTLIKKYKNIIKCDNNFLIFFLVNPSIILFYFDIFDTSTLPFILFFPSLFISFTRFFPIPIKYLFFSSTHHLVSSSPTRQFFFFHPKDKTREIYYTHTHTKERRRIHSKRRRRRRRRRRSQQ